LLLHILPEQRPPQVPRERHLRLGPQRGELTGHALPLRGGFPGDPPGGGQVDPQLFRLAECVDQPVPCAGRLPAGPGDKFLDLAPVIAAPRHLELFFRCRAGQKMGVAAPVIFRRARRAGGFRREPGSSGSRCSPESS
jgi:hypothetical protein